MKNSCNLDNILEISSKLSVNKTLLHFLVFLLSFSIVLCIYLEGYVYLTLIIYITIGFFIFIIASHKFSQLSESMILTHRTLSLICLIIFIISFTSSIAYLQFFESLYNKSLWYYFFIGVCTSATFVMSISSGDNLIKRLLPYLTFVLSLNIYLSNFIVFPNGVYASGDTHFQTYSLLLPIIENGHVPSGLSYSFFPIHQILVASFSLISHIDPSFMYKSTASLLYAASTLFIYSLINRASCPKFGIIGMLLFMIMPNIFYHATHVFQYSYALPLGILLIYITIVSIMPNVHEKNQRLIENRVGWAIISILTLGTIIWTHEFTSAIIFALIVLLGITNYVISKNDINTLPFPYSMLSLYIVMLFAHWIYISSVLSSMVGTFDVYYTSLFTAENYQAAILSSNSTSFLRPLWLIFIDTSGTGIIMMLATMGFLYGMGEKNKYVFMWFIMGAAIWTLVSFGGFVKMPLLLGNRFLALFEAMSLVYLAMFGTMFLIERFGRKGLIFCSILLLIIPIFSLGSTVAGSETSLFIAEKPYAKFYDTFSDLHYRAWIKNTVPDNSNICVSEPWALQYLDNLRAYGQLPVNDQDQVADNALKIGEYVILNKHDSIGLRVRRISEKELNELVRTKNLSTVEAQASYKRITKLDISEIKRITSQLGYIYSNGDTSICLKDSN